MRSRRFYLKRIYKEVTAFLRSFFVDWKKLESNPPETVKIELTNICNANCIFCGYQYDKRKKGIMSEELYSRVLKEYREMGGSKISFSPFTGEPLLDPNFIDRVKKAKSLGFTHIYTHTNGILLYKYDPEEFLKSGIDCLIVSTAPFDKQRWQKLYQSKEYDRLLEGLNKLLMVNKKLGKPVKVKISFRSDISLKDALLLPDYRKYVKLYIDEYKDIDILLKGYDSRGGVVKQKNLIGEMELCSISRYRLHPCSRTFSCLVTWDGDVRACSCRSDNLDEKDSLTIDNLKNTSLKEIWFGTKIKELRRSFVKNTLPITCRNCGMYNPA